jgi:ferrous iron transport protein B
VTARARVAVETGGEADAGATLAPLVVLVGRPNSGKSSLFNAVTGGTAHVGNFPGITVDTLEAEAKLPNGKAVVLADLPGLYSLEAVVDEATDEGVARRFVFEARRTGRELLLVQVVDATNLALHLRLTRELTGLGLRVLVAISQSDLLQKAGIAVDLARLEKATGASAVLVSARSKSARDEMLSAIERGFRNRPSESPDFDPLVVTEETVTRPVKVAPGMTPTERLDAMLLHPVVGPVIFVALMGALFAAVFLVADPVTTVIDATVAWVRGRLEVVLGHGVITSFITDGLLGGTGTVLAFLPQIVILTVVMELLEGSGYLARGAFLVDRLLRFMGLSGRSFLPLLMGHACAVPAISATRIVRDPKERLTAILVLPLMTCSARIPTYALIVSAFFFRATVFTKAAIFVGLYFAGLLSGLVASLALRRTVVRGRTLPLVLEMPAYRMPQPAVIARQAFRASTRFLRDVGTTILIASAVLWAVLTLPSPFSSAAPTVEPPAVEQVAATAPVTTAPPPAIERSVAASVGRALEPVTRPLGFDWRINVGLIGSFGARELMVGTLGIIFGIEDAGADPSPLSDKIRGATRTNGQPLYPVRTGLALLAFFVVACQCMSTVAAIKRETRSLRWPVFVLAYTYAAGYVLAAVVYGIAKTVGL